MKQGRSIQEVLTELNAQKELKKDYVVPAASMSLADDGQTFTIEDPAGNGGGMRLGTTGLFHRQMGAAVDIPWKYYEKMQREKPELLSQNINAWLHDTGGAMKDNAYMIRTMDYGQGRVARAWLSSRYRRVDNLDVAAGVLPLFADKGGFKIESCEVNANKFYLKITNQRLEMEVRKGDIVQAGVVISNSEVGLGAVSVQPMVLRLVCLNGLVVNALGERKHHVGRTVTASEDSYELYSDEAREADDRAFILKLRDVAMAAVEEARFAQVVDKLRESTERRITGPIPKVVELTARSFGMSGAEQDGVLKYLIEGGDLSLYGLTNAVTRLSQDVESYDRATALEGIGWQVATMEPGLWKEINDGQAPGRWSRQREVL